MTEIVLLDGGMGQELVHRAGDRPTPLWSTQVMMEHPGLVAQVHRDFTAAGATVATTNTYAIHRDRLNGTEFEAEFEAFYAKALEEVKTSKPLRVAGSIGPLGASYRADVQPPRDDAVTLLREVAEQMAADVDFFLCETVVSVEQTRALVEALDGFDVPYWIAFSVSDTDGTKLRSGEDLAEGLAAVGGAEAVMVNCSAPEAIPAALEVLGGGDLPFGAYANGFERITEEFLEDKPTVDALRMRWNFTPELYADHVMGWIAQGATVVGGCCEVGPAHIEEIASRLRAAGHTIV